MRICLKLIYYPYPERWSKGSPGRPLGYLFPITFWLNDNVNL
ncbi:hypothetical protein [Metallosphaera tengchongensis]|nr:hypothetical protein [Metallosphaera tengchongensis]